MFFKILKAPQRLIKVTQYAYSHVKITEYKKGNAKLDIVFHVFPRPSFAVSNICFNIWNSFHWVLSSLDHNFYTIPTFKSFWCKIFDISLKNFTIFYNGCPPSVAP